MPVASLLPVLVDVVCSFSPPTSRNVPSVSSLHPCGWGFWIPAVRALARTGAPTFEAKIAGLSSWGGDLRILAFPFWAELARNIEHRMRIHHNSLSLFRALSLCTVRYLFVRTLQSVRPSTYSRTHPSAQMSSS